MSAKKAPKKSAKGKALKSKVEKTAVIGLTPVESETTEAVAVQGNDHDLALKVCAFITEGHSVRMASKMAGLEPTKFYRMLSQDEGEDGAIVKQYVRARAARADARFERIDDVLDELRAMRIDHNTARLIIDAIKWQAGKENAKRFGDKVEVEQTGKVEHTIKFTRG